MSTSQKSPTTSLEVDIDVEKAGKYSELLEVQQQQNTFLQIKKYKNKVIQLERMGRLLGNMYSGAIEIVKLMSCKRIQYFF